MVLNQNFLTLLKKYIKKTFFISIFKHDNYNLLFEYDYSFYMHE